MTLGISLECHYAFSCGYAEPRYAKCHYAACCYAECRGAMRHSWRMNGTKSFYDHSYKPKKKVFPARYSILRFLDGGTKKRKNFFSFWKVLLDKNYFPNPGNTNWRGRLRTVDLHVLTSLDQLNFIWKILFSFLQNKLT